MTERPRFDLPTPDDDSQPFWDAARQRRLVVKRCKQCRRAHFYPRPFCPHCWSSEVEWQDCSGRASLYTYSVVHRNDLPPFDERVPYVAAIVDLEEGVRMATTVDCDPALLEVGMALEARFVPLDHEFTAPVFVPIGAPR